MKNVKSYWLLPLLVFPMVLWAGPMVKGQRPSLPPLAAGEDAADAQVSYRNVRLLLHLQDAELSRAMGFFTESLGAKCMFCHSPRNFASDDLPHKVLARKMVEMVRFINERFFDEERITCFTCHSGSNRPADPQQEIQAPPLLARTEKTETSPSGAGENVQRLLHLTEDDLIEVMDFFVKSVGAEGCITCHAPSSFSSDEVPMKIRARDMIAMAQETNRRFFPQERIRCFTCHRGEKLPGQLPETWTPGW